MEGEKDSGPGGTKAGDAPLGPVTPPPPPSEPPPYVPPVGVAPGAAPPPPPYAPPAFSPYSPPPMSTPIPMPSAFAPPRAAKKGSRVVLIVGIVAVVLVLLLAGGGFLANASLSARYSPKAAVLDYFSAQARGDVAGMMANATYTTTDPNSSIFFTKDAVAAMMENKENRAISNVSVTSVEDLDSSTSKVTVSLTWNGTPRTQTYVVRKDMSRAHDLFYYSWRVNIPSAGLTLALPNQPGVMVVDNITVTTFGVQVIPGYHTVTMLPTDLYDETSQSVSNLDGDASVTFAPGLSQGAYKAASDAVTAAFAGCDATKYQSCPNHTYHAPNSTYIWYLTLPGYPEIDFTSYVYTFNSDPTANMKIVVQKTKDELTASGTCAYKLTVDGSRTYNFTGTWSGTLIASAGSFGSDITFDCTQAKA